MSFLDFLLGPPLRTSEEARERLGPAPAIPIFGLDALSSAAYGPEAALTVLIPLGAAGLYYIVPISAAVIAVLIIVYVSYRQTIAAYPTGGGSYTVAHQNLGVKAGLFAGAALMLDYILNVAVAISAGTGALISVVPKLQPHTLSICLGVLLLLTLINLRGIKETSFVFLIPTCLFVGCLAIVIAIGMFKIFWSGQSGAVSPRPLAHTTQAVSAWLVIRAFASGCTALTGVEAVSNGVKAFREPVVESARRTLTIIIFILVGLLAGIAFLVNAYQIVATPPGQPGYDSVLSQLSRAIAGNGVFYKFTMASVLMVLMFSANTSFADFPRVCRAVSADAYMPQSFANRGRRLVYSEGIVVLACVSGILLWTFGGITDRLIPLFAVGAFLAFTLSQAGMVMHWKRNAGAGSGIKLIINAVGAATTGATAVVIILAKFVEGAWISILILLLLMRFMFTFRHYYDRVGRQLAAASALHDCHAHQPLVVVPIETWNRVAQKAVVFAFSVSSEVHVVHVKGDDPGSETEQAIDKWQEELSESARLAGYPMPVLVRLSSPYRFMVQPVIDYVLDLEQRHRNRIVAVVIPQLVESRWYYYFLHNQRSQVLAARLLLEGDRRIVTVNVPWYLR
jgi:amino acid transporter